MAAAADCLHTTALKGKLAWFRRNGIEWSGVKHPFGCLATLRLPDQLRAQDVHEKLSPAGEDCLYLGPNLQAGHQWRG